MRLIVAVGGAAAVRERSGTPARRARLSVFVVGCTGAATATAGTSTAATGADSFGSGGAVAGLRGALWLPVTVSGAEGSPLVDKNSGPVNRCRSFTTLKPARKKSPSTIAMAATSDQSRDDSTGTSPAERRTGPGLGCAAILCSSSTISGASGASTLASSRAWRASSRLPQSISALARSRHVPTRRARTRASNVAQPP